MLTRKILIKLVDSIFLMRPLLLLPVWAPFLIGYYKSGIESSRSFIAFIAVTLLGGSVYIINQIYDIDSDRANKKLPILTSGYLSIKWAFAEYIVLSAIAILLFFIVSLWTGILAILGVFLGILYSVPRYSLKDDWFWALILNAFGHGSLIYILGSLTGGHLSFKAILHSLPYFIAYGAVYVLTTIPDIEGDILIGKKTIACVFGVKKAKLIALVLIIIASILGYFIVEQAVYMAGIFALPFLIASYKNPTLLKYGIWISVLMVSIAASVYFPLFFILIIAIIIISTLYYNKRASLAYPFSTKKLKQLFSFSSFFK